MMSTYAVDRFLRGFQISRASPTPVIFDNTALGHATANAFNLTAPLRTNRL
jgi:hypothetical protein